MRRKTWTKLFFGSWHQSANLLQNNCFDLWGAEELNLKKKTKQKNNLQRPIQVAGNELLNSRKTVKKPSGELFKDQITNHWEYHHTLTT